MLWGWTRIWGTRALFGGSLAVPLHRARNVLLSILRFRSLLGVGSLRTLCSAVKARRKTSGWVCLPLSFCLAGFFICPVLLCFCCVGMLACALCFVRLSRVTRVPTRGAQKDSCCCSFFSPGCPGRERKLINCLACLAPRRFVLNALQPTSDGLEPNSNH